VRTIKQLGFLLVLSLAIDACSSKGVSPPDGATFEDAGGTEAGAVDLGQAGRDAGDDVTGTVDGTVALDLQPVDTGSLEGGVLTCGGVGSACLGQTGCSSGDDVDIGCRSILLCQNGSLRAANSLFIRCGATAGSACPATQPVEGTSCSLHTQTCSYVTGTCTCANGCEGGTDAGPCARPTTWHCDAPPPSGCPMQAPQLGAPCANGTAYCSYGNSCASYQVSCQSGYWEPNGFMPFGGCA
jgi:hypothetical protein